MLHKINFHPELGCLMTTSAWRYLFDDDARQAAEDRYREFREQARTLAVERLAAAGVTLPALFCLKEIDFDALKAVGSQWLPYGRRVSWSWPEEFRYWRKKRHSRWNLAIWNGGELCLLALGAPSRRKTILYFHGVERHPESRPYTPVLLLVALQVAEIYATLIGACEVRIREPHPKLVAKYESLGYTIQREPVKFWLWSAVKNL